MLCHFSIIDTPSPSPTAPVAFLSLLPQPAQQRDMLVLQGPGCSVVHQPSLSSSFSPWSPHRCTSTVPGSAGNSAEMMVCGTTSAPREEHRVAGSMSLHREEHCSAHRDRMGYRDQARGVFSTACGNVICPRQERPEVPSVTLSFL